VQNKKVLITGGSGFIGINLAKQLLNCGADVVLFDDEGTFKNASIKAFGGRVY